MTPSGDRAGSLAPHDGYRQSEQTETEDQLIGTGTTERRRGSGGGAQRDVITLRRARAGIDQMTMSDDLAQWRREHGVGLENPAERRVRDAEHTRRAGGHADNRLARRERFVDEQPPSTSRGLVILPAGRRGDCHRHHVRVVVEAKLQPRIGAGDGRRQSEQRYREQRKPQ